MLRLSDVLLSIRHAKDGVPFFLPLLTKSRSFALLRMTACLGGSAYRRGGAEPGFHLVVANEACLLVYEFSPVEHDEVGDAAHVVTGSKLRVFVRVNFEDDGLSGEVSGGARDFGRGYAAGATPVGPEIDEHGNAGILQDVVEKRGVSCDGLGDRRQRVLAGTAAACVG